MLALLGLLSGSAAGALADRRPTILGGRADPNPCHHDRRLLCPDLVHNRLGHLVRIGDKLVYCLRDLHKRLYSSRSPLTPHFPGCSKDHDITRDVLGTSVGWSDDYPADYPEQWIDVTGLHGRFAFFQVVDPYNHM